MSPMVKLPLATEHALLGCLWDRPMHAYEMHRTMMEARALGLVWRLKQAQLYALLARLEEAGYLATTTETQGTRPPRKILHLTEPGRQAYQTWLHSPVEHGRDFRIEFLAKLFFAQQDDPDTVAALVDTQRKACETWLVDLRERMQHLADTQPFERLVQEFRAGQIEAILRWLDTCALTLAPGEPA
jgi:PadR family transcriptional regulator AphA